MKFRVLTLFPLFFESPLKQSIIGKAVDKGLIEVFVYDIRDFVPAEDKHRNTDDAPYGGGCGMVMKVPPVVNSIEAAKKDSSGSCRVVLLSPRGARFDHAKARELSIVDNVIIVCGRYEGIDERVRAFVDDEISIGDYVLSGGEPAALCVIDGVSRFIPGVLGAEGSLIEESFSEGLLEYPHYTRPEDFRGMRVPDTLLSGNHAEIRKWRRRESLRETLRSRPELLESAALTEEDKESIKELTKGG
ncbi:MAG: tRNA (guanosine(37)-N1)-methyltransferase TrmD [Thermodesulfobacteriota bacterium]